MHRPYNKPEHTLYNLILSVSLNDIVSFVISDNISKSFNIKLWTIAFQFQQTFPSDKKTNVLKLYNNLFIESVVISLPELLIII